MYFVHARADFKAASTSLSILKLRTPIGGSTFLPASVISPNRSSRLTRSLFNSVQGLFRFLGVKHCILLPSISLCRLSIHPKQSASSTASRYQKCLSSTGRPRFTSTQHSLSLAWWASSHARNSLLLAIQRMLCSSINSDLSVSQFGCKVNKKQFRNGRNLLSAPLERKLLRQHPPLPSNDSLKQINDRDDCANHIW